ncbi:GGDEF domain-containing protein [Magnetofaba australis]|uniref:GGDEF domain-containing protein n=1 Tax=Magnetofaba australis IT-1 TaxID=1434232 RepID=A0A1Y2K9X6_9PROT|nr:GGDEF domain-containing protein [Magnetofaba australis]OSM06161.1 putative Uncharacterized protein YhcK [Magnetofaba australis IT-1]
MFPLNQHRTTYIQVDYKLRILIVTSAYVIQFLLLTLIHARRIQGDFTSPNFITSLSFGIFGGYLLLRNFYTLLQDHAAPYLHAGAVYATTYFIGALATTGWTLGFLMIGYANADAERQRMLDEVQHLARTDALTGLWNRLAMDEILTDAFSRVKRSGKGLALLVLDLDGFKGVNDTHGHHTGDAVLVETAQRIQNVVRQTDSVARLGGDEFVVILEGIDSADHAGRVAGLIVERIAAPYTVEDLSVSIGTSIGVAFYGQDGETGDELLKAADGALYAMKEKGKGGYVFAKQRSLSTNEK